MYCPKCGKENPEDARFCMHCGADLSGYKVEISPKIDVSPSIKITPTYREPTISSKCAICDERKAVVTCGRCGRRVCNYHYEAKYGGLCTVCAVAFCENRAEHEDLWAKQNLEFDRKYSSEILKGRDKYLEEAKRLKSKLPKDLR